MPKFNQFSEEVATEYRLVRDFGGPEKAPKHADSYKAQALRGVANRLWYEEKIKSLEYRLGAALDIIDCFDIDAFVKESGYTKEQAEILFKKFKSY